ncbi:DNA polymerase III subunit alpha [Clostridium tetani]|uniref:DNA polymerase III subunit alpha n=1 Tax=Clostridium tetani TaxID=1513 RepID=UPI00100A8654|nr:DNA polymerase III subunit alpha [Clostridium tetani]RXI56219.1 DNA polymerase III subunit alpha [Clostridium tetani]
MSHKEYNWISLHQHTEYSLLDSSAKITELIKKVKELGMKSIAITDHGVMYGCVEFYKEAIKEGIKPIIGCEIYVVPKSMHIKRVDNDNAIYHLVLLVKNDVGYRNLMEIVSKASIDGFYYKPRVDHEFLREHSEGLIASSACLGGEVQSYILKGNIEKAEKAALNYKEIFKEGFYLELQDHGMKEQVKVNNELIAMSKRLSIPLVATNDVHYIEKEDSRAHDILLCVQTGKTVEEENRMRYPTGEFYLKSPEEMYNLFSHVPEALENTIKIAEQCNFQYNFHESKLPTFPLPDKVDNYDYLRELCYEGLKEKYDTVDEKLKNRLEYELNVIKEMGYVDYFLIVWDFIRFAKEKDIMTGPGRGSGAGSIVAYTLGITKIDPIKYGLIFERFLNPERISMPDIDSDFCYERRQEVIDYVVEKYGENNVSQIATFGTMAARACIRDVGRAMNYSYVEVDKIAKMIPTVPGTSITIDKALQLNPELKAIYENDHRINDLINIAIKLEGLPRHTSTHAAGVVIASHPLVNYVPLQKNEGNIVTQFTMGTLEELGLLKMDFLGLRTLTVMRDAVAMIKENRGIDIDLDKLDFDDKEVYNMIGEGKTVGVFQLESDGMTSFMRELKPDSLEDIIAGISLYRPGPMAEIPKYISNKKNPEKIEYLTPRLEDILSVTYGCMVYQEQVMEVVRKLAGYSMGRSDLVRRAMSKKKHDVMEEERKNFVYGIIDESGNIEVPGCVRNGIDEKIGNKIFDSMLDFASYAFNKSHAAAYAVVAFQTGYLMRYYPTECIAAMLNSVMGNSEKVAYYTRYAKEEGMEVLPPNVNESYGKFTVKGNRIRFGLAAIKNVGLNAIENIVEARGKKGTFANLEDFCSKVDLSCINKRAMESLIKAGAFDSFQIFRSRMLAVHEKVLDSINNDKRKNIQGQVNLFEELEESSLEIQYPNINEFDKKNILSMEKEMTGLYLSGHPLDEYKNDLKNKVSINISDIVSDKGLEGDLIEGERKVKDGEKVIIGGIITNVNKKATRSNEMMAFIEVEDLYGTIEVIIFPKTLSKYKEIIFEDEIIILKGRVNLREGEEPKLICEDISLFSQYEEEKKIYIRIERKSDLKVSLSKLRIISNEHSGNTPVYLYIEQVKQTYKAKEELWLKDEIGVIDWMKRSFGGENVKITK